MTSTTDTDTTTTTTTATTTATTTVADDAADESYYSDTECAAGQELVQTNWGTQCQ